MIEGFITWLCGDSKMAEMMRDQAVFRIVPMLNVDGVAIGNYRTSLAGKDLNREFIQPDKTIYPEVYHLKRLVKIEKQLYRNNC